MSVRRGLLRRLPVRQAAITLAVAAMAAVPLTASAASARTTAPASSAQSHSDARVLEQCLWAQYKPVGNGWTVHVPSVWESLATTCNLKYGDLPRRYGPDYVGDPASAIKALQRNLNYCYGARLVVDGKYGSKTRAAVVRVQRKHRVTVDGIYGPQTRSAMVWRMYHPAKKIWSTYCYDRL